MIRALDALGTFCTFHALRAFCALDALGPLGSFDSLRPLGSLVSLDARDALGTVFAAIFSPVFTPIFATVGAYFFLSPQLDPQPVVILAQPHPLEVELARELLDRLRDLLAIRRGQAAFADADVAHTLVEERADFGNELLNVDHAGSVARDVEPRLFALIFTAIFLPIFAAVFLPVFLAYVGLGERPDRQRQRREQSDGRNSGCD